MRFDELILQDAVDELRVKFHPQLTMLCGLGPTERHDLANGILSSLTGGDEITALHYVDGTGQTVVLSGKDGVVRGQREDGSPAPEPLGSLAPDARSLRRLMLVGADDLGGVVQRRRDDEPPELREARDMLEQLAAAEGVQPPERPARRAVDAEQGARRAERVAATLVGVDQSDESAAAQSTERQEGRTRALGHGLTVGGPE